MGKRHTQTQHSLAKTFAKTGKLLEHLSNPVNLFSGAKLEDTMLADNIIIFKRTSTDMLRPRGVTHNYHHRHELVIPLEKSGRIHVDGTSYHLSPGMVYLIFPHQFHHFLDIEHGAMKWMFITFELRDGNTLDPLRNSPRRLAPRQINDLQTLLKDYISLPPGAQRSFNLIFNVSLFLRRLLSCRETPGVIHPAAASSPSSNDRRGAILERINAYVRSHLDQSVTISDLARHMDYSVSYLRAVFRKDLGVSLGAYMRESRLSIAASMLASPNHEGIEEIAKACGFGSIFAFSRAFKKTMGMPPSAYGRFVRRAG